MSDPWQVELALDARAELGEGAIWDHAARRLYWVDIEGCRLHVFDPESGGDQSHPVDRQIGTVVPRARGGVMLAVHEGFAEFELGTGRLTLRPPPPEHDPATVRFNDGKCDPAGRFWAGSVALVKGPRPLGRLHRLDPDGTMHVMLRDVGTSNGIAWSADRRTLYYIDTRLQRVDAFDYDDATGAIARRRPVVAIPPESGRPDGCTLDAEGMLWIALWEGSAVTRWNPRTGERLETIRLPVSRVTSCAFGGPELATLFITSARGNLTGDQLAAQPLAGGLFRVQTGVPGVPAVAFGG